MDLDAMLAQIPTTEEAVAREEERQAADAAVGRGEVDTEFMCPPQWVKDR